MAALKIAVGIALTLLLLPAALATSCTPAGEANDGTGVVVTILPLAGFVNAVSGGSVDVTVMVPPGASPHTYEPTPSQMTKVADAELYVKVGSGIDFELVWLDKILAQNEDIQVVDCSAGVRLREPSGDGGEGEGHAHGEADPHIWMTPSNAMIMVRNICEELALADPDNRVLYETNRDAYLQQLDQLDRDMTSALTGIDNRTFMAFHDSFGYFADEYDLTILSIEVEGKEPTAASLARLIDQAREHDIRVIFASPQFSQATPEVIADEIGARVVLIDSLAEDYLANMRTFLNELVAATES